MEEQLREAILAVCNCESQSLKRQKNLNRLLIIIQKLPGIYRSSHQDYPEAYNRTLIWVSKNIDRFELQKESTEKSFVIWINGYLKWRIRDLYISDNRYDPKRVYPHSQEESGIDLIENIPDPKFSLSLLDTKIAEIQANRQTRLGNAIVDSIEQDLSKNLSTTYPRKHPQCNCQCLAKRLLLQQPPQKISQIARELNINNQTLYSHWKQKCLPLLQIIGEELGARV
ncbi:MAG: hypothetical protein QNJ60_05665 [Xenococcaceae cyanobacterium MO_188.B19]|nr:hypothetical protein [Xenococcaceae cyanobacterium MO_188.B19]